MIIFTKYYLNMNCTLKIYNFVFVATMKIKLKICSCHFLNHGFFNFKTYCTTFSQSFCFNTKRERV